jgi:hypothetical protein
MGKETVQIFLSYSGRIQNENADEEGEKVFN